jgi:hypothetical protein
VRELDHDVAVGRRDHGVVAFHRIANGERLRRIAVFDRDSALDLEDLAGGDTGLDLRG